MLNILAPLYACSEGICRCSYRSAIMYYGGAGGATNTFLQQKSDEPHHTGW